MFFLYSQTSYGGASMQERYQVRHLGLFRPWSGNRWETRQWWQCSLPELSHVNSSNLLAHLWMNHPALHTQVNAAMKGKGKQPACKATPAPPMSSQPMLQESMTMHVVYEWKSAKCKELTDAVTYFIVKDSLPIFTASSGWWHLIPDTNCLPALTSLEQPFLLCTSQWGREWSRI